MGLVRRGDYFYYYRSVRRDGKVVTRYVASGEDALVFAAFAALTRQELGRRRAEFRREVDGWRAAARAGRDAWRAERARLEAARRAVEGFCSGADALFRLAMSAAGYHQ